MSFLTECESDHKRSPLSWLEQSSIGFSPCVRQDAARCHAWLEAAVADWMRRRGRTRPSPAQRERELYGRPYRREGRHG